MYTPVEQFCSIWEIGNVYHIYKSKQDQDIRWFGAWSHGNTDIAPISVVFDILERVPFFPSQVASVLYYEVVTGGA